MAKITIYVVNHRREYVPLIEKARVALFGNYKPPDTLVGVATLSNPDYLIEVDAVAVIDDATSLPMRRTKRCTDMVSLLRLFATR
nr:RidA family protein [Dyella tabacisoli]